MNTSIKDFLRMHAAKAPISFHMPGHKGSQIYRENGYDEFLNNFIDWDITEIPGADNLFQTEGIILSTMEKYKLLYNTKKSYLLVNGSSGGLIASVLATVPQGGKLIMARNCHKSIFNSLTLGDIHPIYAYPEIIEEYGILGAISKDEIARLLDENPDAESVIIPSPNYYGICSDIGAIAEEVHKRGKILIVDQAHGAHLKFFRAAGHMDYPISAEEAGADLVINSTHKTLASMTQSAVLNVIGDRVDLNILEDRLQAIESSSPSYPMMASLDINAEILLEKGNYYMDRWDKGLKKLYSDIKSLPGIRLMDLPSLDPTKINVDVSAYGINGNQLEELFMEKGIFIELVTGNIVMLMSGIGNTQEHFQKVYECLKEIADTHSLEDSIPHQHPKAVSNTLELTDIPRKKEFVPMSEAAGRVCASSIIPYPPGIPIACPGEILTEELLNYIKTVRENKEKVIGVTPEGYVLVGRR